MTAQGFIVRTSLAFSRMAGSGYVDSDVRSAAVESQAHASILTDSKGVISSYIGKAL